MSGVINYTRVNFKDYPDKTTPITAANLNKLDKGVYDLDLALKNTNDLLGTASQASGVTGATAFAKINKINSDLSNKLSLSGGRLTDSLDLSNNTNNTPEITFTSKDYGYHQIDKYSNKLRFLSSADDTCQMILDSDALLVNGVNVQKQVKKSGENVAWTNAQNDTWSWFYYEGADTAIYNLPHNHVVVGVYKAKSIRGIAIAYRWDYLDNASIPTVWVNRLHNDWKGWAPISKPSNVVFEGTATTNQLIYTPTTGVKSVLVELIDGGTQIFAQMVVPINGDSVNKYYMVKYESSYFQVVLTSGWTLNAGAVALGNNQKIRVIACY